MTKQIRTIEQIGESDKQRMATLLHSPELAKEYLSHLNESHWHSSGNKWIWETYKEHVSKFNSPPTIAILKSKTKSTGKDDPDNLCKLAASDLLDTYERYEKQAPADLEYFRQMMREESIRTNLRDAIYPFLTSEDYLGARDVIDKAYKETTALPTRLDLRALVTKPSTDEQNLLNEWALERQAILAVVAPTGIGKSVLTMQLSTHFACGKSTIGFNPHVARKVLVIQNEDSDNDIANMRDGAMQNLTDTERANVYDNLFFVRLRGCAGKSFLSALDRYCDEFKPDVVFVNPLLKYYGGDPLNVKEVSNFLNELEPILEHHNCGMILVHHTIKQSKQSRQNQVDSSYSGFGSSAWSNSVRDTIEIRTSNVDGYFKLITGKRSSKWGWKERHIKRSDNRNLPCWFDATLDEIKKLLAADKRPQSKDTKEKLLSLIPLLPMTATAQQLVDESGFSLRTVRTYLSAFSESGTIATAEKSNNEQSLRYYRKTTDNANN